MEAFFHSFAGTVVGGAVFLGLLIIRGWSMIKKVKLDEFKAIVEEHRITIANQRQIIKAQGDRLDAIEMTHKKCEHENRMNELTLLEQAIKIRQLEDVLKKPHQGS